jgi:hypothetical protein
MCSLNRNYRGPSTTNVSINLYSRNRIVGENPIFLIRDEDRANTDVSFQCGPRGCSWCYSWGWQPYPSAQAGRGR